MLTMKIRTDASVASGGTVDETALHGERADAGEDVAAVLLIGDDRFVDEHLQEQVVDVGVGRAADRLTTATLLVSGWAPPTPSIWRGSGVPMMRISRSSRAAGSAGQVVGEEVAHPSRCRRA